MGLLNKLFGTKTCDKRLHGVWTSDTSDELTKKYIGDVTMTFTEDGKLIYDIQEAEKLKRMNLVYWTSVDILFTDQPSHQRQEKTKYSFSNSENLILDYNGEITKFKRKQNSN